MDNKTDKSIKFYGDGTCNYCNYALKRLRKEYFPNEAGRRKLDNIMRKIKENGEKKEYDCIVGISGGVDSSYVVYLGYKYGLRMLCVHVDDGFDTDITHNNVNNLITVTRSELIIVKPNLDQYRDLIRSFFYAGVPNIAIPQDNILISALYDTAQKYDIKYILSGVNLALESILDKSISHNCLDKTHILAIHKKFGKSDISGLHIAGFYEGYIQNRYFKGIKKVCPLNFIDYNLNKVLADLGEFCNYTYYHGKHFESILTRFLQCFYLPQRYGYDKRKSHFSSMIVSGQMTREEAIKRLHKEPYLNEELQEYDINFISEYLGMKRKEFYDLLYSPPKYHQQYPTSRLNKFANVARMFRKYLG